MKGGTLGPAPLSSISLSTSPSSVSDARSRSLSPLWSSLGRVRPTSAAWMTACRRRTRPPGEEISRGSKVRVKQFNPRSSAIVSTTNLGLQGWTRRTCSGLWYQTPAIAGWRTRHGLRAAPSPTAAEHRSRFQLVRNLGDLRLRMGDLAEVRPTGRSRRGTMKPRGHCDAMRCRRW
jgi:hypothetical protein